MNRPRLHAGLGLLIAIAASVSPAILSLFCHYKIGQLSANGVNLSGSWNLTTATEITTVHIPEDLGRYHTKGEISNLILETDIHSSRISGFDEPMLLLGRIGDIDRTTINGDVIGQTGRFFDESFPHRWARTDYRFYKWPKNLPMDLPAKLSVRIQKIGTFGTGIFQGPVAIVEDSQLSFWISLAHFLETAFTAALGFVLFGIGIYYLIIYGLIPERSYHLWFALTAILLSVFELSVSRVLYGVTDRVALLMAINALSAIASSTTFFWFLSNKFAILHRKLIQIFAIFGIVMAIAIVSSKTFDGVYDMYVIWIRVFVIVMIAAFAHFLFGRRWKHGLIYLFGFGSLALAIIHDSFNELGFLDTPYMIPYGFAVFTVGVALGLAQEFAQTYRKVELQVEERTKDLAQALDQIRSLEQMKARFFANVSHDFKTPITVALGTIDQARKGVQGTIASTLAPAERSLKKLLTMITNMLDTVKAESGTLKLHWQKARPADLIEKWAEPYQVLCKQKELKLMVKTEGFEGLEVPMDVSKIEHVVDNLLSNAIKFTDRRVAPERRRNTEGLVEIGIRTDESKLYVEISDSGIGIPPDEREKVFDRYFQSSRTSLRDHGGSGIGLSFAKEMVELHNGKIWVEESDTGGSKFVVALPLSQDVEIVKNYQMEDASPSDALRGSLDVSYPPDTPENIDPDKPTILVAEDNPEVAQIVANAVGDEFNIYFATNGRRALEKLEDRPFDCLLTDLVMPEMRGDELVAQVRNSQKHRALPIIILSSHSDEDTMVQLLKGGANDYVTKPFQREILLARLRTQILAYKRTQWGTKVEKLRELGQLSAGIAHQAKNRINKIGNNIGLFSKLALESAAELQKSDPVQASERVEKLEKLSRLIESGYKDTKALIDSIDQFSSGSQNQIQIRLSESISLALTLYSDRIKSQGVSVSTKGIDKLRIQGYNQFNEAIVNLIGNAVDAVGNEGKGKIVVTGKDLGDQIELTIEDNGVGIHSDTMPRIFDPFFTTKDPGEGTGLGLALVRDYIELKHGGKIEIESEGEGKGTLVKIRVPKLAPKSTQPTARVHNVDV